MPHHLAACVLLVAGLAGAVPAQDLGDPADLPRQTFTLDPAHSSVVFGVSHLGFSQYAAGFDTLSAELEIEVADPASARLSAVIDAASLDLPGATPDFVETMAGAFWFDVATHPTITFVSTGIRPTGPDSAEVTGDLTLRGVTRPVTLAVRYNGGYASPPWEPNARIGFSATGTLSRSAFGMDQGVPPPGSTIGVGDTVDIRIEAEFIGPKLP